MSATAYVLGGAGRGGGGDGWGGAAGADRGVGAAAAGERARGGARRRLRLGVRRPDHAHVPRRRPRARHVPRLLQLRFVRRRRRRMQLQTALSLTFSPWFPDRVFSHECGTRQVYDEGARQVAMSVLSGINGNQKKRTNPLLVCNDELFVVFFVAMNSLARICSGIAAASIFAYGQTSSGKTYTMVGITEYSMSDIYDYIEKVINRVD